MPVLPASFWLRAGIVFALYVLTAEAGLSLAPVHSVVTLVWPPSGIAVAALLLFGVRMWPVIAAAAFLVNVVIVPLPTAIGIAIGNTLAAVAAAYGLITLFGFRLSLERNHDVLGLVLAAMLSTAISATVGMASLWLGGLAGSPDLPRIWATWWFGDMLGILLVTPFLVTWACPSSWERRTLLAPGKLLLALIVVCLVVSGFLTGGVFSPHALTYASFPLLIGAAVRYGPRGTTTALLAVACSTLAMTVAGIGPFVSGSLGERLLNLQAFLAVEAITVLILAAALTEHQHAEAARQRTDERYRRIIETTEEGVWVLDAEARTVFTNVRMGDMLGYRPDEMLGRPMFAFMDDAAKAVARVNWERRLHTAQETHDFTFRHRDGHPVATLVAASPIVEGGRFVGALGMVTDITERKRHEVRLAESESLLAESQRLTHIGSWQWDMTRDHLMWSEELFRIFDLSPQEFAGTFDAFTQRVHPEDRADVDELVRQASASATGQVFTVLVRIIRPDGTIRHVFNHFRVVLDPDGRPLRFIGTCQDVTEQRQTERDRDAYLRQIETEHRRSAAIVYSLSEGLLLVGADQRIEQVNCSACTLLGRDASTLIGLTCQEALGIDCPNTRVLDRIQALPRPGASPLALRLNAVPIDVGDTLVITLRDVTHEEEVSRLKSDFISLAAHELRTPMTIMQGYLALLIAGDRYPLDEARRAQMLESIHQQGQRLGRIIDDLLRVAQIEQGRLPVRPQAIAIDQLMSRIVDELQPIAAARATVMRLQIRDDAPLPAIWADSDHVSRILINLVDNAIKYSPPHTTVEIGAQHVGAYVRIEVTDHGPGIPATETSYIFEKFRRIARPETLSQRGTGLGLFISRQLVEMQGGIILVCSEAGAGSTFAFTLPTCDVQATAEAIPPAGLADRAA
ncbi:MAG: MASE1 domain-containing protein [Candidatus Sericytochromatia bacterium]|nr:MASE1 domain-containing protein [Candidatus Sericytochromatia bacterium]